MGSFSAWRRRHPGFEQQEEVRRRLYEVWTSPKFDAMIEGPLAAADSLTDLLDLDPRGRSGYDVHFAYAVKLACAASDKLKAGDTKGIAEIWSASEKAYLRAANSRDLQSQLEALAGLAANYDYTNVTAAAQVRRQILELAKGKRLNPREQEIVKNARLPRGIRLEPMRREKTGSVYLLKDPLCRAVLFVAPDQQRAEFIVANPELQPLLEAWLKAMQELVRYKQSCGDQHLDPQVFAPQNIRRTWPAISGFILAGPWQSPRTCDRRTAAYFGKQTIGKSLTEAVSIFNPERGVDLLAQ